MAHRDLRKLPCLAPKACQSIRKLVLLLENPFISFIQHNERISSEILNTTRFAETSDLSTAYLGRLSMVRGHKMVAEERFSMSEQGYTTGKLLDGTECQILLDTGGSKSFMCKSHYLC